MFEKKKFLANLFYECIYVLCLNARYRFGFTYFLYVVRNPTVCTYVWLVGWLLQHGATSPFHVVLFVPEDLLHA